MTKIDIISGFLGAGKTTFIKKMIDEVFTGEKLVLIENEFGEVGIDGGFLKDAGIEITEMNSGCICCSLVGDFGKNLHEVIEKFHPDRILIEPSGVGKLSDVMKSVIDVEKDEDVKLNGLITVVNALKASKQMKAFGEFFNNQIEHAGTIILSRTQNVSEDKLKKAIEMIRSLNADAHIITTPWDSLDGKQILAAMENVTNLELEMLAEQAEKTHEEHEHEEHAHEEHHHHDDEHCGCGCEDHDHEHEHHHHHHDHDADEVFTSWGVETAKKFSKADIEHALTELDSGNYGMILRSKGIVNGGADGWLEFDYVPGEWEVRARGADVGGKLVVIGSKLNEKAIAELFGC